MEFDPKSHIPSLDGKVILVTGGTDGLGKETVKQLSLHSPAHIYLAGRNRSKAEKVLEEFKQAHPGHAPITFLEMDLYSLASVKAAAEEFLSKSDRLDILVCNAGIMGPCTLTKEGYEVTFGVNYLAHALLTQLLLPILRKTAAQPNADVRVVNVSSMGEKWAPRRYTFNKMNTDLAPLGLMARYGQSKLAQIHYAVCLAQKYPEIMFTSVHPGQIRTNISITMFEGRPVVEYLVMKIGPLFFTMSSVEDGAKGQLWCATGDRTKIKNGAFYYPFALLGKGSSKTKDVRMAEELWSWTGDQLNVYM